MKTLPIRCISIVLILGLFIAFCSVQKSPITGQKRAYGYSWEQELKLGKEADQQIQQQYGVYDDNEALQYVEQVGQKVLEVSHMRREDTPGKYQNTEFHFRLLDSPVVNAFALPGGYVYVTRGLMTHLNNEAQLAVVLGHEIGHVAARHASQRAFEQQMGQLALLGGAVAGQELLGIPGGSILDIGGTAAQFLFMRYSRDDERESDGLGVEYAAKQQYRAAEGAEFFTSLRRISEKEGQSIPGFLSTHPDPEEREESIPRIAEEWREEGYEQTIDNNDTYMNSIDGIVFGENPRQGFTRDGRFYHPDLEFQFSYPDNWRLINQPTQVGIINQEEDAITIFTIDSEAQSARTSVMDFVTQEGFTVDNQQSVSHEGMDAHQATALAVGEDGTEYGFYVFAVDYENNIYRFISYTLRDKFRTYESTFEETSRSFDEVNDPAILNIEPARLQTVRTDRSGTFSSFIPDNLPMDIKPEDIAIVNQVHLDDTIEEGSWIKIPRQ